MEAIIYTSNTGSTERYAKLLAHEMDLPVYPAAEAGKKVPAGSEIIYLGWLMASGIKGYKDAARKYKICAVCGVGMGQTGSQQKEVRERNAVPDNIPLFTLQGNFDMNKLHGLYKMMMSVMLKTAGKALAEKSDRTESEEDMLDMLLHGGDSVHVRNLKDILDWYDKQIRLAGR